MYLLLRDGDSFEIRTSGNSAHIHLEFPLSGSCGQRWSRVDYSKWKNFVDGRPVVFDGLDEGIVDSWNRCRKMEIDPAPRSCWDFMPMDQLEAFSSTLKKICGDVERTAYESIRGRGLLLTFTNANARVVRTCGDLEVLRQADKLNFGPGANWAEECVGTNAIGTSLVTGRPMQVFAEEHFCRSHHSWSCTAAPIMDPHGHAWGCFDISGPASSDHSKSLELVLQATRSLEQRLGRLYCSELEGQLGSIFSSMFNSVMTGILSLDRTGHIVSANGAAETLLGSPWESLRGRKADEFFDYGDFLVRARESQNGGPIVMRCLTNPELFVRALVVGNAGGTCLNTMVTICEPQSVHQVAASCGHASDSPVDDSEDIPTGFEHVLHSSRTMRTAILKAARVARTPSTVLLQGESGTGKELFARGIHRAGPRADKPFVAVNCGAFSGELVQSELFGYRGGSFTGASKQGREGKFRKADKGVLFLDEVSEMPLQQQVNLLRALEERSVVPVGGTTPVPVDVKIIAATNKDLRELVRQGCFREDLFYRLNVVGIGLPPLRERGTDIVLLAEYHLERLCAEFGIRCEGLNSRAAERMLAYDWPGNVRELVNCIEYAVNTMSGPVLMEEHLPHYLLEKAVVSSSGTPKAVGSGFQLKDREADAIREALDFHGGNISKAAKALGIGRNTLYAKMERHSIQA